MTNAAQHATKSYHHGDLRQAVVEGALLLLAETQSRDFSLREVARRIDVSHNAPYWHFPDKQALLVAVAAHGFCQLRGNMLAATEGMANAGEALAAIGLAYVQFGTDNPTLYRLMFDGALKAFGESPAELTGAAALSRGVLVETIRSGARDGLFNVDPDDPQAVAAAVLAAWSAVHGLTTLYNDGMATLDGPRPLADMLADVSTIFMQGLAKR